jgi:hypothetical protein
MYNKNIPPSMKVVTCSLDELDENRYTKTSKEKVAKQRTHFLTIS